MRHSKKRLIALLPIDQAYVELQYRYRKAPDRCQAAAGDKLRPSIKSTFCEKGKRNKFKQEGYAIGLLPSNNTPFPIVYCHAFVCL